MAKNRAARSAVVEAKASGPEAKGKLAALRIRWRWLDHLIVAYGRFTDNYGNFFAAGITYFSFLAIFPIVFLAVSIAGFVIGDSGHLHDELFSNITKNVPGGFGNFLTDAIKAAVARRTSVGIIGVVGVVFSGLGWISNLRQAIDAMWASPPRKRKFVAAKTADLLAMAGLGLGLVISIAITVAGTAASHFIVDAIHIGHIPGIGELFALLGIVLALLGDMVVFGWVFSRFPQATVSRRALVKGALFAAVGVEILKVIGTTYIARIAASPTYGILGSIIGVLVWINLVARYLLIATAWTATEPVYDPSADPRTSDSDAEGAASHHGTSRDGAIGAARGADASQRMAETAEIQRQLREEIGRSWKKAKKA